MPDQKQIWTRCLGGFSVMWVTKLWISPVKKRISCPKTTKFGPKLAFLVKKSTNLYLYLYNPCLVMVMLLWPIKPQITVHHLLWWINLLDRKGHKMPALIHHRRTNPLGAPSLPAHSRDLQIQIQIHQIQIHQIQIQIHHHRTTPRCGDSFPNRAAHSRDLRTFHCRHFQPPDFASIIFKLSYSGGCIFIFPGYGIVIRRKMWLSQQHQWSYNAF